MDNPYQSPASQEPPPLPLEAVAGLKDPRVLALASLGCYGLATLGEVMVHAYRSFFAPSVFLESHDTYYVVGSDLGVQLDVIIAIIGLSSLLLYFMWKYRAACNARLLDPEAMNVSPAMAVVSYFIPLVQIFMPYKAMRGIARATTGDTDGVVPWWACHLTAISCGIAMTFLASGPGIFRKPSNIEHLYTVLTVLAYLFTWQLMMRITRAQSALCSREGNEAG